MKRLLILVCILALLLSLPGGTAVAKPEEAAFTITGYTTDYDYDIRPNGRIKFYLKAEGAPGQACAYFFGDPTACGVTGYFNGTFTFEEWGEYDPASGKGKNDGIMTVTTTEGQVVMKFHGKAEAQTVSGKFDVKDLSKNNFVL